MQNETERISQFINLISPLVCAIARTIIKSLGWQVNQKGSGSNTIFSIKADDREAEFHLSNLLYEIATIDRDAQPLVFDESVLDAETFLNKTIHLVASKLKILFYLMSDEDVDVAFDKITKEAKNYQRIRIIRFDQNPQSQNKQ